MLGIPIGRVIPILSCLGICIRLAPVQVNFPDRTASLISSILFLVSDLPDKLSGPTVLDPRFRIIFK